MTKEKKKTDPARRDLEGVTLATMQDEYDKARAAASYRGGEPARRRELEATQYRACPVCGAEAGTVCIESSRRHMGVVADQVHPGRRLLDPRKSVPRRGL